MNKKTEKVEYITLSRVKSEYKFSDKMIAELGSPPTTYISQGFLPYSVGETLLGQMPIRCLP